MIILGLSFKKVSNGTQTHTRTQRFIILDCLSVFYTFNLLILCISISVEGIQIQRCWGEEEGEGMIVETNLQECFMLFNKVTSGEYYQAQLQLTSSVKSQLRTEIGLIISVRQRSKLCGCQVGLGTSSKILRGSPAVFVLSNDFAIT